MSADRPQVKPDEVVDFVVHGALAPRLIDWLVSQGMDVHDFPSDGLRALMVVPSIELMRSVL